MARPRKNGGSGTLDGSVTADTGFDLSREYEEAKSLFGPLGEGAP